MVTRVSSKPNDDVYHGVGRRKSAVARVCLRPGTGRFTINQKSIPDYFGGRQCVQQQVLEPLLLAKAENSKLDILVRVAGGGYVGQAAAIALAVARALVSYDESQMPADMHSAETDSPTLRRVMRKAGQLTRDARIKERKKYGLKKARKREQYSKR